MESFLSTDLYTFGVGQAVFEHFPATEVTYKFIDRNKTVVKPEEQDRFLGLFRDSIDKIVSHTLQKVEREFLEGTGYFKPAYLEFLSNLKFNTSDITSYFDSDGVFQAIISGLWSEQIIWEVPFLAALTSIYLRDTPGNLNEHYYNLLDKRDQLDAAGLDFCEFGTRRRRNFEYQKMACEVLSESKGFLGTSNSHLARILGLKNIGTTSHQYVMGHAGIYGVKNANTLAMRNWFTTYQGGLSVALTDTYTTDVFLRDLDETSARNLSGLRQDSGNPVVFANKVYNHYTKLGVDTQYKVLYFSDGLNPLKCQEINTSLAAMPIQKVFCIGSDFTNDQKLNLVMKLDTVNGKAVCKIPDDFGKATGSADSIKNAKRVLGLETKF